jgi:hypothetical protein
MHEVCWHSRFAVQSPVVGPPPAPVLDVGIPPAPLVVDGGPPPVPAIEEDVPPVPALVEPPGFCFTPAHAPMRATAATAAKRWRSISNVCPLHLRAARALAGTVAATSPRAA